MNRMIFCIDILLILLTQRFYIVDIFYIRKLIDIDFFRRDNNKDSQQKIDELIYKLSIAKNKNKKLKRKLEQEQTRLQINVQ